MSSNPARPTEVRAQLRLAKEATFCRAKYTPDGRLLSVEHATRPIFSHETDVEEYFIDAPGGGGNQTVRQMLAQSRAQRGESHTEDNIRRAINRAKVRAFDLIMSNPDLLTFVTLTCDPEKVDRTDYNAVYKYAKVWLSNRVARRDLKYVLCPEYHADGEAIHFHMLANPGALRLEAARTPAGNVRTRKGKPVYNLPDWELGFSTAQLIDRGDPREAVAKYIFKYMGKAAGAKIGGRYFLHGGRLMEPYYLYADEITPFMGADAPTWTAEFSPAVGLTYTKHYFV